MIATTKEATHESGWTRLELQDDELRMQQVAGVRRGLREEPLLLADLVYLDFLWLLGSLQV